MTRRRVPLEQTGSGASHRRTTRAATAGGSSTSSSSSVVAATPDRPSFRTHRRLSSYPEAFRTTKRRARRAGQAAGIEMQALSPTAAAKSPSLEVEAVSGTMLLPRSTATPLPPKGHRRIASVGEIERRDTDGTSPSLATEVADLEQVDQRPLAEMERAPPVLPFSLTWLHPFFICLTCYIYSCEWLHYCYYLLVSTIGFYIIYFFHPLSCIAISVQCRPNDRKVGSPFDLFVALRKFTRPHCIYLATASLRCPDSFFFSLLLLLLECCSFPHLSFSESLMI